MKEFEVWEDPDTGTVFYFSHSNSDFTTGVMMIPTGKSLPKHNRPLAVENLVQLSGKCVMKVFENDNDFKEHELSPQDTLSMKKGQFHIHSNPFGEPSYTLFKAVGDITAVMDVLRSNFKKII